MKVPIAGVLRDWVFPECTCFKWRFSRKKGKTRGQEGEEGKKEKKKSIGGHY